MQPCRNKLFPLDFGLCAPPPMSLPSAAPDAVGSVSHDAFVLRHRKAILFLTAALCPGRSLLAYVMPASVFPQTDFPRVVILIDNGVMPADEMMATITRPSKRP